jgi:transcriptional regulator with XRE-family HTH domain
MDNRSIAITIRSKKLGVLIRGARQASEKSVAECSKAIGVPTTTFEAYERGDISPSLPELEALAFYLKVPLELFWGREMAFPREQPENHLEIERLLGIRQRIVGTLLRQARLARVFHPVRWPIAQASRTNVRIRIGRKTHPCSRTRNSGERLKSTNSGFSG